MPPAAPTTPAPEQRQRAERGTALALQALAVLGIGAAVWAGQRFLAPLAAGLLLALLAAPVVSRLQRLLRSGLLAVAGALLFIGLMFWGAMWGLWGLLLGPALVVLGKVVLEQVPGAEPWARLLAGADAPRAAPAPNHTGPDADRGAGLDARSPS